MAAVLYSNTALISFSAQTTSENTDQSGERHPSHLLFRSRSHRSTRSSAYGGQCGTSHSFRAYSTAVSSLCLSQPQLPVCPRLPLLLKHSFRDTGRQVVLSCSLLGPWFQASSKWMHSFLTVTYCSSRTASLAVSEPPSCM